MQRSCVNKAPKEEENWLDSGTQQPSLILERAGPTGEETVKTSRSKEGRDHKGNVSHE